MSDDNSVMEGKLDNIIILLTSMNKKLGDLLAYIGAREIGKTLKAEDKVEKSVESNVHGSSDDKHVSGSQVPADSKALPVVAEANPFLKKQPMSPMTYFPDLKNSTVMAESESGLAYQVIKDGFFTWLAKSHIDESVMPLSMGILLPDILLKDGRKWILGKDKGGNPKLEWKVVGS